MIFLKTFPRPSNTSTANSSASLPTFTTPTTHRSSIFAQSPTLIPSLPTFWRLVANTSCWTSRTSRGLPMRPSGSECYGTSGERWASWRGSCFCCCCTICVILRYHAPPIRRRARAFPGPYTRRPHHHRQRRLHKSPPHRPRTPPSQSPSCELNPFIDSVTVQQRQSPSRRHQTIPRLLRPRRDRSRRRSRVRLDR